MFKDYLCFLFTIALSVATLGVFIFEARCGMVCFKEPNTFILAGEITTCSAILGLACERAYKTLRKWRKV